MTIKDQAPATVGQWSTNPYSAPATGHHGVAPRRIARQWRKDVIEVFGWLSLAMAVTTYLSNRGMSGFSSFAETLTSFGQLAGLLAATVFFLQVLLAARIPFVDKAMGHDHALAKHKDLTVWALSFLTVHILSLIGAWSVQDKSSPFAAIGEMWGTEDIMYAILGVGLIALVGASSYAAVKARLPHEVWHGIHLTTYCAIGLAVPHMFSTNELVGAGWGRIYWTVYISMTAFAMVTFRWLYPLFATLEHRFVVSQVRRVSPDSYEITISGKNMDKFTAEAGQFFDWRFLQAGLWWHSHPLSLSAAPDGRELKITMRILGAGTNAIAQRLQVGTKVIVQGPYGVFTASSRRNQDLILAGAGAGIAPIKSLLTELDRSGVLAHRTQHSDVRNVAIILRARTPQELIHADDIRAICQRNRLQLVELVGRRYHPVVNSWQRPEFNSWTSHDRPIRLLEIAPWAHEADIYVCGPEFWKQSLVDEAISHNIPEKNIHSERFTW